MAVTYLRDHFNEANAKETRTISYVRDYEADNVIDYLNYCRTAPGPGGLINFEYLGSFWIDGSSIARLGSPKPNGKVEFSHTYDLRFPTAEDVGKETLPPWYYPPEISYSASSEEVSLQRVYPPATMLPEQVGDGIAVQWWNAWEPLIPKPLTNTAGVPLEATGSFGLMNLSINYNNDSFNPNTTWGYKSTVNAYPVRVCGIDYAKHTLLLDSISATEQIDYNEDGSIKWRYWKVSASLIANPRSWDKLYLNVGTHLRREGGLVKIWRFNNGANYGSYMDFLTSTQNDGEEVTEPTFLDTTGTSVMPTQSNGRQRAVYLPACPYYPADFTFLNLPQTTGWRG